MGAQGVGAERVVVRAEGRAFACQAKGSRIMEVWSKIVPTVAPEFRSPKRELGVDIKYLKLLADIFRQLSAQTGLFFSAA